MTPLRFFVLTRQAFRSLIGRQPEIERRVLGALEERVGVNGLEPSERSS